MSRRTPDPKRKSKETRMDQLKALRWMSAVGVMVVFLFLIVLPGRCEYGRMSRAPLAGLKERDAQNEAQPGAVSPANCRSMLRVGIVSP